MSKNILIFVMILLIPKFSLAQNNPEEIVKKFFTTYENSADLAIDNLFMSNNWMSQNQLGKNQVKSTLNNTVELIGEYKGFEKVSEVKRGNSLTQLVYFVKYERQPLRFEFVFYKPDQEWRIQNFIFDDKILED
jgi:hypothetical protein